ncbi:MAG TPA: TlpA disulfide reductase family protein [Clostridia bacterium]|nr:TlpA disulfide reductase family protein [Clostridia bacterium]
MEPTPRFIKHAAFALTLILAFAMLFGCAPSSEEPTPAPPAGMPVSTPEETKAPKIVPEFTSTDLDGNEVDNTVFENADFTFINIWGTFCSPCINEMPDLGELAAEYADKGVQFIGIVSDASAETPDEIELAKEIREYTGTDYLHILVSESLCDGMLKGVRSIPTSFIVNSKGKFVSKTLVGSRSKEDWKTFIDDTLEAQG